MPVIYTSPKFSLTALESRTTTAGELVSITDGNPFSYYETNGGTARVRFRATFAQSTRIDSIHVITSDGIDSVSLTLDPNTGLINNRDLVDTFNERSALVATNVGAGATGGTNFTISFTRSTSGSTERIYAINLMRQLIDISTDTSVNRVVEEYRPMVTPRNVNVIKSIYGNMNEQRVYGSFLRKSVAYKVWFGDSNLERCQNEFYKLMEIHEANPNFTLLEIKELGTTNYESCYKAHWGTSPITAEYEGQNVISYSFSLKQK